MRCRFVPSPFTVYTFPPALSTNTSLPVIPSPTACLLLKQPRRRHRRIGAGCDIVACHLDPHRHVEHPCRYRLPRSMCPSPRTNRSTAGVALGAAGTPHAHCLERVAILPIADLLGRVNRQSHSRGVWPHPMWLRWRSRSRVNISAQTGEGSCAVAPLKLVPQGGMRRHRLAQLPPGESASPGPLLLAAKAGANVQRQEAAPQAHAAWEYNLS